MSDRTFERAVTDWLEDGSDRTPERAIDGVLLAVRNTPQERDLRIPWRLPHMPILNRAIGIAAVALVVLVGAGGFIYLTRGAPAGVGGPAPTASPTPSPTQSAPPTPGPSEVAPGITGWTPYSSQAYGIHLSYPVGWDFTAASRAWQPGDGSGAWETAADLFGSPDNEVGVAVWQMPAGDGADLESGDGLQAWAATTFCTDQGRQDCDTFADRTELMCLDAGDDPCRAALLVRSAGASPADDAEFAFFPDWTSQLFTAIPDKVTIVEVGRGDAYPGAAPYGGAVQLLKSFLSTMGVTSTVKSN
jgi:hypothetical protein